MSSDEGDDELEERANELWGMEEVRGGGGASTVDEVDSEAAPPADTADASDSSDTNGQADETAVGSASDTADTVEASDTDSPAEGSNADAERAESAPTSDSVETSSRTDPTDTENTADTTDTTDTPEKTDSKDTTRPPTTDDSTNRGSPRVSEGALAAEDPTVRQLWLAAETEGVTVRDLHNVNVYLYEDIYEEMRRRFKQLDAEHLDVHGEDLSKNKAFFNAVFRAGLNSPELREELELD